MVVRSYLYIQFVFPGTLQVISNFWLIFNINRELILPKVLDKYVSSWDNHLLHTLAILPLIVDLLHNSTPILLPNRRYCATVVVIYGTIFQAALVPSVKEQNRLKLLLLHIYSFWPIKQYRFFYRVAYLYYSEGIWMYDFYGKFQGRSRLLLAAVLQLLLNLNFEVGFWLVARFKTAVNAEFIKATRNEQQISVCG